jgi:outer membrane protein OmpA-like peptidoglycan-associated protein
VLIFASAWPLAAMIERRLEARAHQTLLDHGLGWADVQFSGRVARLVGQPPHDAAGREAILSVRRSSGSGWIRGVAKVEAAFEATPTPVQLASAGLTCVKRLSGFRADQLRFGVGAARLSESQSAEIAELARMLRECPDGRVRISGHTDDTGAADANYHLSALRAASVAEALIAGGVPAERIETVAYGATRPLADAARRDLNRRIEIDFLPGEGS